MKNKRPKIQILLSTFNGEKYLRQQLDSYLRQEGDFELRVLIRDDGSLDGTREILEDYERKAGFEVFCGENVGVNQSMKRLFENSDLSCDYFALSDQDDVWREDKLRRALESLADRDSAKPQLYASLSRLTDERMNFIGMTGYPKKGASYYNALTQNICQGHTEVFNRSLLSELRLHYPDEVHAVDWWIYLLASALGEVFYDGEDTVYHRQHGVNSVGYETGLFKKNIRRLGYLREKKSRSISRQLQTFYEAYRERLPEPYRKETESYLDFDKSLPQRILWLLKTPLYRQKSWETLIFKGLYLFGCYDLEQ